MGATLFGAALLCFGIFVLVRDRRMEQNVREAELWPSVTGVVTESEVRSRGAGKRRTFEACIRYEYSAGGETRTSSAVVLGGELRAGRLRARARCDQYPVGKEVQVFYDPGEPERACLERRREGRWLELLGAAFAVGAGLVVLFR